MVKRYVKSAEHLANYVQWIANEHGYKLNGERAELLLFYKWSENGRAADLMTWKLRQCPQSFTDKNWLGSLKREIVNEIATTTLPRAIDAPNYSETFLAMLERIIGLPGVYFLFGQRAELLYIGRSFNLASRLPSSIKECNKGQPKYVKLITTRTAADASVLEAYFIGRLKPAMNGEMASLSRLTLKIKGIPKASERFNIYEEEQ